VWSPTRQGDVGHGSNSFIGESLTVKVGRAIHGAAAYFHRWLIRVMLQVPSLPSTSRVLVRMERLCKWLPYSELKIMHSLYIPLIDFKDL
jgi:hypothetical protein